MHPDEYDNRMNSHAFNLADRIRALPDYTAAAFSARVMADGLMLPSDWKSRVLSVSVWLGHKLHRVDKYDKWVQIFTRHPDGRAIALDVKLQTAHWAVFGTDTYDPASVGGFSKNEMRKLAHLCDTLEHRVTVLENSNEKP